MSTPSSAPAVPRAALTAMIACLALAVLLRLPGLGAQSLWIDEIYSIDASSWSLHTILTVEDGHPPLDPLVLKLARAWFPYDVTGRAISALAGIVSVGLLYVLAARLWDRRTAIIAALLLAVSPMHVWYSREGRIYALVCLWSILSSLCLEAVMRGGRRRALAGYALVTFCGLMSHYSYVAIVIAQLAFLCLQAPERTWRAFAAAGGVAVVAVALTLPVLLPDLHGQIGIERTFTWFAVPYAAFAFIAGFGVGPSVEELHRNVPLAAAIAHWPEVAAVAVSGVVLGLAGLRALRDAGPLARYVTVWLVVPVALGIFAARVLGVAFNVRYVIGSLPAFELILALGLARYSRGFAVAGLCALFAIATLSICRDRFDPRYQREDLRGVARYLESAVVPGDAVVLIGWDTLLGLRYYRPNIDRPGRMPQQAFADPADAAAELRRLADAHQTTWLVLCREWTDDRQGLFRRELEAMYPVPAASLAGARIYRLGG